MVNLRKVALSCKTFSHYTTTVDLDKLKSIEEVIEAVVDDLDKYLKKVNLDSLSAELRCMNNFHHHDYTFEEMLLNPGRIYYVCDHEH